MRVRGWSLGLIRALTSHMTVPAVSLVTLVMMTVLWLELAMSTIIPSTSKLWALGRSLGTYLDTQMGGDM